MGKSSTSIAIIAIILEFLMGKSTFSVVIFGSYVKLPEGTILNLTQHRFVDGPLEVETCFDNFPTQEGFQLQGFVSDGYGFKMFQKFQNVPNQL